MIVSKTSTEDTTNVNYVTSLSYFDKQTQTTQFTFTKSIKVWEHITRADASDKKISALAAKLLYVLANKLNYSTSYQICVNHDWISSITERCRKQNLRLINQLTDIFQFNYKKDVFFEGKHHKYSYVINYTLDGFLRLTQTHLYYKIEKYQRKYKAKNIIDISNIVSKNTVSSRHFCPNLNIERDNKTVCNLTEIKNLQQTNTATVESQKTETKTDIFMKKLLEDKPIQRNFSIRNAREITEEETKTLHQNAKYSFSIEEINQKLNRLKTHTNTGKLIFFSRNALLIYIRKMLQTDYEKGTNKQNEEFKVQDRQTETLTFIKKQISLKDSTSKVWIDTRSKILAELDKNQDYSVGFKQNMKQVVASIDANESVEEREKTIIDEHGNIKMHKPAGYPISVPLLQKRKTVVVKCNIETTTSGIEEFWKHSYSNAKVAHQGSVYFNFLSEVFKQHNDVDFDLVCNNKLIASTNGNLY